MIHVKGADLMDGTPIYDIKPYVVYADCHPEARSGFVDERKWAKLEVVIPDDVREHLLKNGLDEDKIRVLADVLAQDPRLIIKKTPIRYMVCLMSWDIHFVVSGQTLTLQK